LSGNFCGDDGNLCTSNICVNGECHTSLTGAPCDDGDLCTVDICGPNGECLSDPKKCISVHPCLINGSCDSSSGICLFDIDPNCVEPCYLFDHNMNGSVDGFDLAVQIPIIQPVDIPSFSMVFGFTYCPLLQ
jgi:hypothetical protein